ncbi:MAG: DinB family protein [Candidatus Promineifilaceae bacterium]
MDTFFKEYYELLSGLHNGFEAAVEGLPVEALDWSPGGEMNSIAVLMAHTAGSERYWIGEVAGEDPANRVRSEEFNTKGATAEELQQLSQRTLAHSRAVLSRLSEDELAEARNAPAQGRNVTVAYALLHSLEHTAGHLGHAQVVRDLWDLAH